MRRPNTEHVAIVSPPQRDCSLGRVSTSSSDKGTIYSSPEAAVSESSDPATSTYTDQDTIPNIAADSPTDSSNHSTTQAIDWWQTRLEDLYSLPNDFHSEFDATLQELRAGIAPLPIVSITKHPDKASISWLITDEQYRSPAR